MKKNQIICTLPLPEVAKIARKSARTIRRWCQLGLIKGARCSKGGHWKVRVCLSGKDEMDIRTRARKAGGAPEDFDRELWVRTQEKVWDLVAPAGINRIKPGFERHKPSPKPTKEEVMQDQQQLLRIFLGEDVELVPVEKAWQTAAAFEWAESFGHGKSLLPIMEKVRRIGFMPVPLECFNYKMKPEVQTALDAAPHKPMFMAFYGAALNLFQSTGRCSVSKVCKKLGVPRATAYRHGLADAVAMARQESGRDLKKSSPPQSASANDERAWNSNRAKNTVHRDSDKWAGATKRRR